MAAKKQLKAKGPRAGTQLKGGSLGIFAGDPRSDPAAAAKLGIKGIAAPKGLYTLEDLARAGKAYVPGIEQEPSAKAGTMGLKGGLVGDIQTMLGMGTAGVGTKDSSLPAAPPRPSIPEVVSSQKGQTDPRARGGAGISSPLKEGLIASPETVQRTYWPVEIVISTDGILAFEYEPIKTLKMVDAENNQVEFQYQKEP